MEDSGGGKNGEISLLAKDYKSPKVDFFGISFTQVENSQFSLLGPSSQRKYSSLGLKQMHLPFLIFMCWIQY